MSRGLTDPIPEPEQQPSQSDELDQVIREIIIGQNKLHDRLIQVERQVDHLVQAWQDTKEATPKSLKKKWNKGL
jgi:hypothetical protein